MSNEQKKDEQLKEFTNWIHSLFILDRLEKYSQTWENSFERMNTAHKVYRLYIQAFWNEKLKDNERFKINSIFNQLQESNWNDELEVRISSYWWFVDELSRFQNIIKTKFKWRTTTILDNSWLSCWALIFLMWDNRIVHKDSYIMFHYFSWWIYWKGWEIKDRADFTQKYYEKYFREALKEYFTKKEIDELIIWKDYWLTSEEMLERWIATKII